MGLGMTYTKMDINEIRRANLRLIASENFPSRAEFCRAIGRSEQQMYAVIGPNASKAIGEVLVRDIEKKLGYEPLSLDRPLNDESGANHSPDGINLDLLEDCIVNVEQTAAKHHLQLSAAQKAQAVALAYGATVAAGMNSVIAVDLILRSVSRQR